MAVWSAWGVDLSTGLGWFIYWNNGQCGTPRGLSRRRPIQALRAALTITDSCDWALLTDYIELVVRYWSIIKIIDQCILVLTMRYNLL